MEINHLMFHIIYMSSARLPFSTNDLSNLLDQSRKSNAACDVTGILLYKDGNFLQVMEGEKEIVESLFNRITADKRHFGVKVFFGEEIPAREFGSWTMAFRDLTTETREIHDGFDDILNTDWSRNRLRAFSSKVRNFMGMFSPR